MKRCTRSDKTACSRWQANQFRLFLHMGAYWLLHSLRRAAPKRSRWRGATFETIRRTFVKIAVRVEELKGKIKLAFPASYPHAAMLVAHDRRHHDAWPMTDAARCRASPSHQPPTRSKAFPKPPPSTRRTPHVCPDTRPASRIKWASRELERCYGRRRRTAADPVS